MNARTIRAVALVLMLGGAISVPYRFAQSAPARADIARGEHIARLICSTCHVVAADQEYPPLLNVRIPSFSEIANRPGTTADGLRRFVTTTHWDEDKLPLTMPNPMISNADALDVARYIISLRSH